MIRRISAPGKAFLCGEYAVLDGAPALVAATSLGVSLSAMPASAHSFTSSLAPNDPPFDPASSPKLDPPAFGLVRAVLDTIAILGIEMQPPARIDIDSTQLHMQHKLGLGSSGAVAAGLVSLIASTTTPDHTVVQAALNAHHTFQNHVGSGSDVLASLHGGLCTIQNQTARRNKCQPTLALIPSGTAASTPSMVRALDQWKNEDPASARRHLAILSTIASRAANAAAHNLLDDLHQNITEYGVALDKLTHASSVPIVTPRLRDLCHAATGAGWAAKPSGAGGGDVVIAMSPPRYDVHDGFVALTRALEPLNAQPLRLEIAAAGTLQQRQDVTSNDAP